MPLSEYIIINITDKDTNMIVIPEGIRKDDISELVELLNNNDHIKRLSLYRNNIGNESAPELAKLNYITHLNVSSCDFDDDGILPLISKSSFTHLDLSGNSLTDNSVDIITKYSRQIWLNINGNTMSEACQQKIYQSIGVNRLPLNRMFISSPQGPVTENFLTGNSQLKLDDFSPKKS